jgi:hypothetical protein
MARRPATGRRLSFETGQMERPGTGEFRLADRPWRLAHSYTLQAVKD